MKKLVTFTAIGTVICCSNAFASGFNLREQSASAMGNAFTGATAGAEDISYSFWNPAGLTRHKGNNVSVNATYVGPRSKAKRVDAALPPNQSRSDDTGYTDNIVHEAVLPALYASYQLNDDWFLGISSNSPFGMVTKYDDSWAGRYHGTLSKVITETLTPMVAYQATEALSLGAGFQIQYVKARLRNSVMTGTGPAAEDKATLQGDTTDIGYTLGAMYEFNPGTRIGIGYRSEIKHKLKGDIKFDISSTINQDIFADLTTPATLTVGGYHELNDRWAVMAEAGQTYWSSFEELRIRGEGGLNNTTEEKWKDTIFYGIGATYKYNDQLKFRVGVAFDQSAVGKEYRTPRIPDGDRKWYSIGAEYKYDCQWTFNAGYTYIRANNGQVALRGDHNGDSGVAGRGSLYADYENDIHIFGVGFNYNF